MDINLELLMKPEIPTCQLSNEIRGSAWEDVNRGLDLICRFIRLDISVDAFIAEYGSFYYQAALDGHEDHEGPLSVEVERRTLALRLLKEAQDQVDRIYDGEDPSGAYADAGRISRERLRDETVRALALSSLELARVTLKRAG